MKLIHFCLTKKKKMCSYFQGEKNKAPTALGVLLLNSNSSAVSKDRNCISCWRHFHFHTEQIFENRLPFLSLFFFFNEISSCRSYPCHHLKMEIKAIQKHLYPFWNALFLSKISATGDFLPICSIVCSYGSQFYHCYLSFIPPRNQHRTHSTSIPKLQKKLYLSC